MQTDPPSVPVSALFPDGNYPECQWESYKEECAPAAAGCWLKQLLRCELKHLDLQPAMARDKRREAGALQAQHVPGERGPQGG